MSGQSAGHRPASVVTNPMEVPAISMGKSSFAMVKPTTASPPTKTPNPKKSRYNPASGISSVRKARSAV